MSGTTGPRKPASTRRTTPGRPLAARSVIASILLPLERPELPGRSLVRCCELFGIAEGTTRVALSRMVARRELDQTGGIYRLTGSMLARQARQRAGRWPQLREWDGRWIVAVVVAERRMAGDRAALRRVLLHNRLAELREGVWTRPDNVEGIGSVLVEPAAVAVGTVPLPLPTDHCTWWRAELAADLGAPGDSALAARLWDLQGWADQARWMLDELDGTLPRLDGGDPSALAPCFAVAAATVRHLTADPLLPSALLPARWPAGELRERYATYEGAYRRVLAAWIRADDDAVVS